MSSEALSIINRAEYLSIYKNGRNCHYVNNILIKIYHLCKMEKLEEARPLLEVLYRIIHQKQYSVK